MTADTASNAGPAEDASDGASFALLVPCRAAMHGRMALHGTYFKINEVFLCQDLQGCDLKARQPLYFTEIVIK